MNENTAKQLCLALMRADSEEEAIRLLKEAGFWNNPESWRFYGDRETNFNTIGNQQSRPDAALVEKLVNSVDARLMNECLANGINPEDPSAPQDIQEAVAQFFDSSSGKKTQWSGRIREWPSNKRTEVARGITLSATGARSNPCFTISDIGEGQTPKKMPHTILSLDKENKLKIPFVQGKFNMGGTGALKFCGKHNLQLVISRRNPAILEYNVEHQPDEDKWSFTIVRREDPHGNRRSSVYTYLAPFDESDHSKGVLRFSSQTLPIFPEGKNPYAKQAEWGTLIKLYDYSATGFKSHILMKDGLLGRVDLLLPDIALPMRFHECRDYRGHEGSFETSLTGLRVRLDDDRSANLEEGFPVGAPIKVAGEEMLATIYAFKKKRSEAYRKNEGIIFVVNGQTHGYLTQDFFSRNKVGLSYLADSILVLADCTKLSGRAREDLFMNSRDRLSKGELHQQIEESLEELLKHHQGLRELKERRRREEIESRIDNSRPLEDILEKLMKQSPILSSLFLQGLRLSVPFRTTEVIEKEEEFKGKRFPTHFKFKGKDYGQVLNKDCHINMRCRLTFETDVENEYFSRAIDPGEFNLTLMQGDKEIVFENYVLNLQNGIATLSISLPNDVVLNQEFHLIVRVNDCSLIEPFKNEFNVIVKEPLEIRRGDSSRRQPPGTNEGDNRERSAGIQMPNIKEVHEEEWQSKTPPFDKFTALRIINAGNTDVNEEDPEQPLVYDFFVNVDNFYLKTEMKNSKAEPELIKAQFVYGMVLIGLSLLKQDIEYRKKKSGTEDNQEDENGNGVSIEKKVEEFSRAVSPVILPIINSLGSLSLDDEPVRTASGDAT